MGITIPKPRLRSVLEQAMAMAESEEPLDEAWSARVLRIADCPSKSYVAALGTALLAKAADVRVDALAVKADAGPTAYSMRSVVAVLVERAPHYGYHLGATRGEPLNNQPWFRIRRVDDPVAIKQNAREYHRDLIRYLRDLNNVTSDEALEALAVFLRLRIAFGQQQREAQAALRQVKPLTFDRLVEVLEHFLQDDPEGGRRGQALVAAVLDLLYEEVELSPINDPSAFDVRVLREGRAILGVEVKQKPVHDSEAIEVAEGAAAEGVDKAILVAIAKNQGPLSRDQIRRDAERVHGVLAVTYDSVSDFLVQAATFAGLSVIDFADRLPAAYLARMQEHGVTAEGQQHWTDLCAGLSG